MLNFTGFTALDALELGFRTNLLGDCSRGIAPDAIKETLAKIKKEGGLIINSSEVIIFKFESIAKKSYSTEGKSLSLRSSL